MKYEGKEEEEEEEEEEENVPRTYIAFLPYYGLVSLKKTTSNTKVSKVADCN